MPDTSITDKSELLPCPFCEFDLQFVDQCSSIFFGQTYSDRYPEKVAKQNNGYKIRCEGCGCQTCWWHYEWEAISSWNHRA